MHDAVIAAMSADIVRRYAALESAVDGCRAQSEQRLTKHELYTDLYRRCLAWITVTKQQLIKVQDRTEQMANLEQKLLQVQVCLDL